MAKFDGKRWTELREKRKRKEKLSRQEKLEWHELDAARSMVRARERMTRAREMSRRHLNSIRMEIGTIAVEAGLGDAPRERIRQALETLARELAAGDGNAGAPDAAGPAEVPPANPGDERILTAIAAIPAGAVSSYGRIAEKAGLPGQARTVGEVLARHPDAQGWHRIVNSGGRIRTPPERGQRTMLEAEGVAFALDRVDLDRFAPSVDAGGA